MKNAMNEVKKKGTYLAEVPNDKSFEETLRISNENLTVALNYKDGIFEKETRLKLLIFQNRTIFRSYCNWFFCNYSNGKKLSKKFHFFGQTNFISNKFLVLITPKTKYNYFMGENKCLIVKKMDSIGRLFENN